MDVSIAIVHLEGLHQLFPDVMDFGHSEASALEVLYFVEHVLSCSILYNMCIYTRITTCLFTVYI